MATPKKRETKVVIRNLVKLLGEKLYDDPAVVLRELISNANDGCILAMARFPELNKEEVRIEVVHVGDELIVRDTGLGMTENELDEHLSTVCNSDKRLHAQQLRESGHTEYATRLIGQFGLGFLTTFVVSRSVAVETLSRTTPGEPGWRWESTGDTEIQMTPIELTKPGTTVRMRLNDDKVARQLKGSMSVKQRIEKYSRHITVPIYYGEGEDAELLNGDSAPWHAQGADAEEQWQRYLMTIDRFSDAGDWLAALAFRDELVQGILYFPYFWGTTERPVGVVDVHCRGPLVEENSTTLVPPMFRCIRGMVQSSDFSLRLDRGAIKVDEVAERVRKTLEDGLLKFFTRRAASKNPDDHQQLQSIIRVHGNALMEGFVLIENEDSFSIVAEMLPLSTTEFVATNIPDYLERSRQRSSDHRARMFYFKERLGSRQTASLVRKRGWELIDCSHPLLEVILRRYTQNHDIQLHNVADDLDILFDVVEPDGGWEEIVRFYKDFRHPPYQLEVKLAMSNNNEMPLCLLPKSSMVSNRPSEDAAGFKLYVNKNNPLLNQLAEQIKNKTVDRERLELILHESFHHVATFCDELLDPSHLFEYHQRVLMDLATMAEQVSSMHAKRLSERLGEREMQRNTPGEEGDGTVFVGLPFKEEYTEDLYKSGLKSVISELGFKPVMLEEEHHPGVVHEQIEAGIRNASAIICDVTESNPNVHYEIGLAHGLQKARRTLLVCDETKSTEIPFNTRHWRVLKYDLRPARFSEFLGKVKEVLQSFQP